MIVYGTAALAAVFAAAGDAYPLYEAVAAGGGAAKGGDPLFRAGWMTDTHIGKTRESCRRVKMALELFWKLGVVGVINSGDIADHYYPAGYEAYRAITDETFAGAKKPQEIYAWAWHDVYEWNGQRVRESTAGQRAACYADVAKRLGIPHKMTDKITVNGYTFLVFPQWTGDCEYGGKKGNAAYEQAIADAEAAAGGKPVFVVDHVPPAATVANSVTWGCGYRRKVFESHPGVIHLSGHTHGSLRDENNIWQGNFTAVNATCLQVWEGDSAGIGEPSKENYGACVIEGFADRIVFRRFDVRDGAEYKKRDPWCVPWPFDPKTAPYSAERRKGTTPAPAFAADARVGVRADAPFTGFTLALPAVAEGADSAYRYRISAAEKTARGWRPFKTVETYTQFYLRPEERAREVTVKFSSGYFEPGRAYRFEAAPVNFFGGAGKPVCAEAVAPAAKGPQLLWKSGEPMAELKFVFGDDGTDGGRPVPEKDGWYAMTGGMARLVIPAKAWDVPKGTPLRFTVDVETVQEEGQGAHAYNVQLMRFKPALATACGRIKTPGGESGVQRYVIEFRKLDDVPYSFVVREGAPGKVKFHSAKIERID
ncbi:MAG TPA: hypothetical protein PKI32_08025 [Opitutales bacterium]|nr:hypothetical protein [Opitutales bacterium]